MIKKTNLQRLTQLEFFQVMSNIQIYLGKEDLETLGLARIKTEFDTKLKAYDDALKVYRKHKNSEQITELDKQRDTLIRGFQKHISAFYDFPNAEKQAAAKKLDFEMGKYGKNIAKMPLQEETATITQLLQEFSQGDLSQAVTLIGAKEWLDKLGEINSQFVGLHTERTEEVGTIELGQTKKTRQELQEIFTKLAKNIEALAIINGEEPYRNLVNSINEEIKKASV